MTSNQFPNEPRRTDPELRGKVEQVLEARADAVERALPLLREAAEIMSSLGVLGESPIFARSKAAVQRAASQVGGDAHSIIDDKTDIYVGNMAVGELGDQILAQGANFDGYLAKRK